MSSTIKTVPHFLFSAYPAWGHIRAFCNFAARVVKNNEHAVVTILLAPNLLSVAKAEVAAEFQGEGYTSTLRRVRVLSSFHSESQNPLELWQPHIDNYAASYQDLLQGKSITCAATGAVFDATPAPHFVIMDTMAHALMLVTRAISGSSVPIVAWLTGHVASLIRVYGPEHLGGHGDLGAKIDAEAARKGVTSEEIGDSVYSHTDGTVIKIPGVPDMHDWEFFPQKLPFEVNMSDMYRMIHSGIKEGDMVFVTSTHAFEERSMEALKSWFSDWKKEVYIVGPLLPTGYGTTTTGSHRGSIETRDFLEKSQAEYGEKSVILISFGTVFWPTVREYIEEVVDALIEKKVPFIITYASPFASISDELVQRIKKSGHGLISQWFPQQYILNHPATGWFISHCGQNSIMESLGSGTPVICWPFESDQPAAAAHLTENLKVAFELIEVRTGENGMKPLKRNGRKAKGSREAVGVEIRQVIDDCRGEKGRVLRKNAEEIKAKLAGAWIDGGIAKNEFQAFLSKYGV